MFRHVSSGGGPVADWLLTFSDSLRTEHWQYFYWTVTDVIILCLIDCDTCSDRRHSKFFKKPNRTELCPFVWIPSCKVKSFRNNFQKEQKPPTCSRYATHSLFEIILPYPSMEWTFIEYVLSYTIVPVNRSDSRLTLNIRTRNFPNSKCLILLCRNRLFP